MAASVQVAPETRAHINKLMADLRFVDKDLAKEARRALLVLAKKVAVDAQSRAPRRTGLLAAKTRARVSSSGDAMITNNSPAARPNEFGGRHPLFGDMERWYPMRKQAFMFPAVEAHAEEFYTEAEQVVDAVFAKIGFK